MKVHHLSPMRAISSSYRAFLIVLALGFGAVFPSFGSDPVGVYAYVDKVVLEPNDTSPERIQIWGGFALAEGRGETYAAAQPGYMYFQLPSEKEKAALREWNDLKSLEGAQQLVAFGSRYDMKARVRKTDDKPRNPDVYVVDIGLTKVTPRDDYPPHKSLIALRKSQKATAPSQSPKK
jgi:hypothetical protein